MAKLNKATGHLQTSNTVKKAGFEGKKYQPMMVVTAIQNNSDKLDK